MLVPFCSDAFVATRTVGEEELVSKLVLELMCSDSSSNNIFLAVSKLGRGSRCLMILTMVVKRESRPLTA